VQGRLVRARERLRSRLTRRVDFVRRALGTQLSQQCAGVSATSADRPFHRERCAPIHSSAGGRAGAVAPARCERSVARHAVDQIKVTTVAILSAGLFGLGVGKVSQLVFRTKTSRASTRPVVLNEKLSHAKKRSRSSISHLPHDHGFAAGLLPAQTNCSCDGCDEGRCRGKGFGSGTEAGRSSEDLLKQKKR